ncbi:MAG: hypothetical protein R6U32_01280 [Candidatus Woesearchaeota archaeon]
MTIRMDDYSSEEAKNILADLLYEFGVDISAPSDTRSKCRPPLKIVKERAEPEDEGIESRISTGEGKEEICEDHHRTEQTADRKRPMGNMHIVEKASVQVSIEDLLKYHKHNRVIGEEKNSILQTLCAINNLSFGIEGNSGSGKTYLMEALTGLIPEEQVYTLGLASEQAAFHDSKNINKCRFIYIPEIQKVMERQKNKATSIIEMVKDLTEGKASSRIVTKHPGEVEKYKIQEGKTIIYTLALENSFKKDPETSRRFIRLMTDVSDEHVEEVMNYKAKERCTLNKGDCLNEEQIYSIKKHIKDCLNMPEIRFFDPFSVALNEYMPALPKSIGFVDHYYGLLDSSAKFHHKNRIFTDDVMVLDFEDHYLVKTLYFEEFCDTLEELSGQSVERPEFDWKGFWQQGVSKMKEQLPSVADRWIGKQVKGEEIKVYDVPSASYKHIEVRNDF